MVKAEEEEPNVEEEVAIEVRSHSRIQQKKLTRDIKILILFLSVQDRLVPQEVVVHHQIVGEAVVVENHEENE
jgi:hypothetical protein